MGEMEEIVGRLSDAPPVTLARLERAMASVRPEPGEIDALIAKREALLGVV
jgi:beta-N-acetylhexosaminidase